ncbi:MAG: cytochrome c [Acidimicrobiales bacterium]
MLLAASTQRTIGFAILAIVFIGGIVYLFFNIRSAKPEVGSELELAANRSPALLDEDLEGRRLDLALLGNLAMLTIIAIALPFYWLGEPGREDGRNVDTDRIFTNRGENIYVEGAQCVNCHGAAGAGGSVTTSITDDDGGFVAQVVWQAPALNTVLSRHSEDEILHTLNFGRNGVMPAWGGAGGGPLTDQQLEEVVFYMRSIQIDEEQIRSEVAGGVMQRVQEWIVDDTEEWDAPYLTAIRDAQAAQLSATIAVETPDIDCTDFPEAASEASPESAILDVEQFLAAASDEEIEGFELCDTLKVSNDALTLATTEGADQLEADAIEWLANAEGVAETAREMALADDPSLDDPANVGADGQNLPLRWAALDLLTAEDSDVPNVEDYIRYGEFIFTNPAVQGTYSCARCHTFGFSYDAAERFTVRANGTTESILPDGYDQGGGYFGPPLTADSTRNQFETARTHAQFIETGQTIGQPYGRGGSGGNGQMPGFAARTESDAVGPTVGADDEFDYPALLTSDQIDAVVAFERNL